MVEIGERQVRDHLTTLVEKHGALTRETEGCGFVWKDDGLHRIGEHGDVELAPVELADLSDAESVELARSSNYTFEFRTSPTGSDSPSDGGGEAASPTMATATNGGDSPPHDAD